MKLKGSTWNYRVMAHLEQGEVTEIYLSVHIVYYRDKVPVSYAEPAAGTGGESPKSIKWTLKQMKKALKKPILWYGDRFPEEHKPIKKRNKT